jgi:hypothetical protein
MEGDISIGGRVLKSGHSLANLKCRGEFVPLDDRAICVLFNYLLFNIFIFYAFTY